MPMSRDHARTLHDLRKRQRRCDFCGPANEQGGHPATWQSFIIQEVAPHQWRLIGLDFYLVCDCCWWAPSRSSRIEGGSEGCTQS